MHISKLILLSVTVLLATGCAQTPTKPVPLTPDFYAEAANSKIGFYTDPIPAANTYFPGASCLLCMAAAEVANSGITEQVQTFSSEKDLQPVSEYIETRLNEEGVSPVIIKQPINWKTLKSFSSNDKTKEYATKDFRSFKTRYNIDKLVILDINTAGVIRSYSSYVPTSAPMGYLYGYIGIIDLSDNSFRMYKSFNIKTMVEGEWDEPDNYPGLTNAYYQSYDILTNNVKEALTAAEAEPANQSNPEAQISDNSEIL